VLDAVERAGNRLPDPVLIFLWLILRWAVLSVIGAAAGWEAVNPISQQPIGRSACCRAAPSSACSSRCRAR